MTAILGMIIAGTLQLLTQKYTLYCDSSGQYQEKATTLSVVQVRRQGQARY